MTSTLLQQAVAQLDADGHHGLAHDLSHAYRSAALQQQEEPREVAVTEEMKLAGVRELFQTDIGPKPEAWEEKIARVYIAMLAASPSPQDFTLPMVEEGKGTDGVTEVQRG